MPKYRVFATVTATLEIGVFEANSAEEAREMGLKDENCYAQSLCNRCSDTYELNDIEEVFAEETE